MRKKIITVVAIGIISLGMSGIIYGVSKIPVHNGGNVVPNPENTITEMRAKIN